MGKMAMLCIAQIQACFGWAMRRGWRGSGVWGSPEGCGYDVEIGQPAQVSWVCSGVRKVLYDRL